MTYRRSIDRLFAHTYAPLIAGLVCLTACQGYVGEGGEQPSEADQDAGSDEQDGKKPSGRAGSDAPEPTDPGDDPPPTDDPPPSMMNDPTVMTEPPADDDPIKVCNSAPERAEATLTTFCSGCHGDVAAPKANFGTILNVPALLASGKVVKDNPAMSPIYRRIVTGTMPPAEVQNRPGPDDITAIKEWIDCGAKDWGGPAQAALPFTTIDSRLRAVLDDLRSFSNPADRERFRYFDLTALSNAGVPEAELQVYREALAFLVNSLSRGRTVIPPEPINENALIFRIDLRDYLWDEETWTDLEEEYPYAVIYDRDSRLFPFDEDTAERLRDETGTQIPVIQADWFISHASRPPLYHRILDLPNNLGALQQQLGLNIQGNIDGEQVQRAGFADAGNSLNNRIIERHEIGGGRGAVWLAYDFVNNLNQRNVFTNPIDFQEDSIAVMFNLENGLQGYFLANGNGQRVNKAPNNILQDPRSRDGAVENGLSCMNCHQTQGPIARADEIRDFQLNAGANIQEINLVLGLYPEREEMAGYFEEDQALYENARDQLEVGKMSNTTMHDLNNAHLGTLDVRGVAGVLGLRSADFKRAIDASPQFFPPEIVTLRTNGGSIQRDAFEAAFEDIVEALNLGEVLDVEPPPPPQPPQQGQQRQQ